MIDKEGNGFPILENGCQNPALKDPLNVAKSYYYLDIQSSG